MTEHSSFCDSFSGTITSWSKHLPPVSIDALTLKLQSCFFFELLQEVRLSRLLTFSFAVALRFLYRSSPLQTTEVTLCPAEPQRHRDATRLIAPLIGTYPCPLAAGKNCLDRTCKSSCLTMVHYKHFVNYYLCIHTSNLLFAQFIAMKHEVQIRHNPRKSNLTYGSSSESLLLLHLL